MHCAVECTAVQHVHTLLDIEALPTTTLPFGVGVVKRKLRADIILYLAFGKKARARVHVSAHGVSACGHAEGLHQSQVATRPRALLTQSMSVPTM